MGEKVFWDVLQDVIWVAVLILGRFEGCMDVSRWWRGLTVGSVIRVLMWKQNLHRFRDSPIF